MSNKLDLTEREQKIYDMLRAAPKNLVGDGMDVPVTTLYSATGHPKWKSPRGQQQFLGAYFSRLNVKLAPKGFEIKPGVARGTYRLRKIAK